MEQKKVIFLKNNSEVVSLNCDVAKSYFEKTKGLMYRESIEKNKGMLFPFIFPFQRFFWMKNVKIPLDIIFVNRNFEIIYIHEAQVEKGLLYKTYWSHGLCKYVIETNMGFCKKNKVKKRDKIKIENL